MSVVKVIEIIAEGKSVDDAIENAVKAASESVRNIKSVYANNISAVVENDKLKAYRVNAKVSFVVE